MKRWWWVLAAIVLFFIGDRVGATLLGQLLDRSPQRFCQLYAGKLDGEIALAGNSRGVVDLHAPSIAEATRKTAVNVSHNGMTGGNRAGNRRRLLGAKSEAEAAGD